MIIFQHLAHKVGRFIQGGTLASHLNDFKVGRRLADESTAIALKPL